MTHFLWSRKWQSELRRLVSPMPFLILYEYHLNFKLIRIAESVAIESENEQRQRGVLAVRQEICWLFQEHFHHVWEVHRYISGWVSPFWILILTAILYQGALGNSIEGIRSSNLRIFASLGGSVTRSYFRGGCPGTAEIKLRSDSKVALWWDQSSSSTGSLPADKNHNHEKKDQNRIQ